MLPRYDVELDPTLPPGFSYWVPKEEDIDNAGDEGLGFFRSTWLLGDVEQHEARDAVAEEAALIDAIEAVADDASEFDDLCSAAEWGNPDDIGITGVRQRPGWSALDAAFPSEEGPMSGLELGVGGLSFALAAVGLVPVASCRSHPNPHSWSDAPVVFFSTDRPRALVLQRLVEEQQCGLDCDEVDRPQFMTITARDVRAMNALATAVLDASQEFGPGSVVIKSERGEDRPEVPTDPDQLHLPGFTGPACTE
jgi:hypothetical protein